MFRTTLRVSATSEPEALVASALIQAERHGLVPSSIEQMRGELLTVVAPLVTRAADFERIGSRLVVERQIHGEGYEVTVDCRVGDRPDRLRWLKRLLSR